MPELNELSNRRILVIDDNEAIHTDFLKILGGKNSRDAVNRSRAALFGEQLPESSDLAFELDSAFQGQEGVLRVRQSLEQDRPYAMAFVDVRMPPGWDGIKTIGHLWEVDPKLLIVICTAHNDYDWSQMESELGNPDRWVILKKPFDGIEVRQLACSLTTAWHLARRAEVTLTQLERLVEDRTQELAQVQQQLLESQKLEAIGTLTGGIAHEFNNLLQIIIGYTQAGMEDLPPEHPGYQDLAHVLSAAAKAAKLTSGLLGFGRRQMLNPVKFDPNEAISDLLNTLRPVLGEEIKLETDLADNVGFVHADPTVFQQMLTNLFINARDAMPSGGCLSIATEPLTVGDERLDQHTTLQPGRYVQLRISDTGCGMSPEVQQRVFEPFFTTKEVGQGCGLGLATVYGNVQQLKGSIELTSQLTKGTTFSICLPAITRSPASTAPTTDRVARRTADGSAAAVLVVDDQKPLRDFVTLVLTRAGYETLSAADGDEAVELFERNADRISLVLLDVVMPRMGGHETYRRMQQIDPDIPVIVCSGYDPRSPHLEFVVRTGLTLIRKPFERQALLQAVQEALVHRPPALCVS